MAGTTTQDLGSLVEAISHIPFSEETATSTANKPQFVASTTTGSFNPNHQLHVTYGVTRLRQYFDNDSVGEGWPQKLGLKGVSEGDTNAFPVVTFSGADMKASPNGDTNGPQDQRYTV